MPTVKYSGSADTRSIDANAWKKAGVEDQNKVEWSNENDHTAEVSEAAARYLVETDPKGFKLVEAEGSGDSSGSDDDDTSTTTKKKTTLSR